MLKLCDTGTRWNRLEAVLNCRPALMKCVYIICPFVSTSYLVAVQASPQAWPLFNLCGLPTGHTLRRFQSDKSSALVIRCTHYDSQRCLIKQTFQQLARRPSAVTDTWLCCVLCDRVVVQEDTCWWQLNKRLTLLSCWGGRLWVKYPAVSDAAPTD